MDIKLFHKSKGNEGSVTYNEAFHALNITIICYRYRGSRGEGKVILASKLESLPILVLETMTFLLASIYRGFLARMRSHPHLVNPPCLGGNPWRGLARIVLAS